MDQGVKFKVIEKLKELPVCNINSTDTQYVIRCKFCGDSMDKSHGHLSIKIDTETETPMMYRCLKCDASGLLSDTVLEEHGIYVDSEMQQALKVFNKKINKKFKLVNTEIEKFNVPLYVDDRLNYTKLQYLNKRLGTSFDLMESRDIKAVLNIFDFMKINEIESIPGLEFKHLKFINEYYLGFLSTNNNCITFRNITNNNKFMRYYKVKLNPKNVNADTFYSVPNSIDLLYTNDIHVHITEGIMDILSVYKNVIGNKDNNFYYASCGFGYLTILKYLIHHGINTGLHIHIYSDNDKRDWDHMKYLFKDSAVSYWLDHIWIHRNKFKYEKDYGVPLSRIIDKYHILK